MNAGVQNIMISLGAMQSSYFFFSCSSGLLISFLAPVARRIPFDDPVVLNYVRLGYVLSQIIIIGTYFFVSYKVLSSPPCLQPSGLGAD